MTTINQLLTKQTIRKKKKHRKRTTALQGNPQRKAICTAINREKPKKPNSALRKVLKVFYLSKKKSRKHRIILKKKARVHAPGEMPLNHFAKFQRLLIRGCRVRDLPGVRYRVILGKLDVKAYYGSVVRTRKRSKYTLKKIKS